jgi:hypothetical protein
MISNFFAFSSCIVLKRIKLKLAVAIKTENWDLQILQNEREMTIHRLLAPTWNQACGCYGKREEADEWQVCSAK